MDYSELRQFFPVIDPEGFADVMRDVGNAIWRVQQLEEAVQTYLVLILGFTGEVAADVAEGLLEKNRRKTLGKLVRELNAQARVPEGLSERLNAFVEPRNWLVHRSQNDSRRALVTPEGRATISAKLDAITDEAGAIQRLIVQDLEAEMRRQGVTDETLMKRAQAELRAKYGT